MMFCLMTCQRRNESGVICPVVASEHPVDYAPTQFMAEMLKNEGFDGVCYQSVYSSSFNYAFWDTENFECGDPFLRRIIDYPALAAVNLKAPPKELTKESECEINGMIFTIKNHSVIYEAERHEGLV
jgi:hypothetical protein